MKTTIQVKSALDNEVKTISHLLQKLTVTERINYIQSMIPALLTSTQEINASSQRLAEKQLTPFNNLTQSQRDLIDELTFKTACLFKVMSEEN